MKKLLSLGLFIGLVASPIAGAYASTPFKSLAGTNGGAFGYIVKGHEESIRPASVPAEWPTAELVRKNISLLMQLAIDRARRQGKPSEQQSAMISKAVWEAADVYVRQPEGATFADVAMIANSIQIHDTEQRDKVIGAIYIAFDFCRMIDNGTLNFSHILSHATSLASLMQ